MIDFTHEVEIDRPVHDVFAYSTDPERLPTWQTNTVSSITEDDGPLRVGTRLREVHRGPGGKEFASVVEVSQYDPDRVFALHVVEGTPIDAELTYTSTERGTLLRLRAHGKLTGAMRLAEPFLGRMLKRQFAEQVATLKHVLEQDAAAAA
jgi:uncharacterized protein YndB with AHSA1/START domain